MRIYEPPDLAIYKGVLVRILNRRVTRGARLMYLVRDLGSDVHIAAGCELKEFP